MRCGVCGQRYGDLMVKHGQVCDDDSKAEAQPYAPEIDDLITAIDEAEMEEEND